MQRRALVLIALVTLVAWQFPWGQLAVYPFTLLATYAHEMGHGITAWLLGGRFTELVIHSDGSGAAQTGVSGRIGRALVAGGGLVGPSILGGVLLACSRIRRGARMLVLTLGLVMWLSLLLVVRNPFGAAFVVVFGGLLLAAARFRPRWCPFILQLVAVQLCLSVFRDLNYMFSPGGTVGGVPMRSDSAAIAQVLWLPYWFWGGVAAVVAFGAIVLGGWFAFRPRAARRAL